MKRKKTMLCAVWITAVMIVLYPFAASRYNRYVTAQLTAEYAINVSGLSEAEITAAWEAAVSYNESLRTGAALEEDVYEACLNLYGDGMMGALVIEKIGVNLPIYHYSTEEVLTRGAGHLEDTALPVGGESTHCVLTGHRGLPGSSLFTYLDELEEGDLFYLKILNQTLAYEVTQIQIVEPQDTSSLNVQSGEDLCTLVTCTPYGVNTHRLLVTGTRTEFAQETEETGQETVSHWQDNILIAAAAGETILYLILRKRLIRAENERERSLK